MSIAISIYVQSQIVISHNKMLFFFAISVKMVDMAQRNHEISISFLFTLTIIWAHWIQMVNNLCWFAPIPIDIRTHVSTHSISADEHMWEQMFASGRGGERKSDQKKVISTPYSSKWCFNVCDEVSITILQYHFRLIQSAFYAMLLANSFSAMPNYIMWYSVRGRVMEMCDAGLRKKCLVACE